MKILWDGIGSMKTIQVTQTEPEVPAEVMAEAIVKISKAMEAISKTRLTRRAIVTLIHENSKISRCQIEIVLNNLDQLEKTWLKPK